MSKNIANITDYLVQIEKLTNTNLQILKTINDSFFTKKNHLYAEVNDTTYVIPSFVSLENKINMLQENFENLVKSPETSEAYFNFDGNSRSIEVRKYNHAPNGISLSTINNFFVDNNDIFKDFMTPVPYINVDLQNLSNDIVEVNVKKIIPKSNDLKDLFRTKLEYKREDIDVNNRKTVVTDYYSSINERYSDIVKSISAYKEDVDYVEYDTIYKLPIRKNIGTGMYVIESVISDEIDADLNEIITLKLRNNLTNSEYKNSLTYDLFDETIEKSLQVGDELINYDGTGKVVITEIRKSTNTIVVKVVNGEYLNFVGTDSYNSENDTAISDVSKLRFNSSVDFNTDKYIKIPLEEDEYTFIAVAPLNSRMNIRAPWGTGLIVNTNRLYSESGIAFNDYYKENVKNIGDILFEITSMITSPITNLSETNFKSLCEVKPNINTNLLNVMQINKHLNDSDTVKNIRNAYSQKKKAEAELTEVQNNIAEINSKLVSISFEDTTGIRNMYTSQLTRLNERKNSLMSVINTAINTISISVNSSDIPLENAKYRIRGFYVSDLDESIRKHIIGIKVQYRYKNISSEYGNAVSMSNEDKTYIYSDWNNLVTFNKDKVADFVNGKYVYSYEADNESINEPSYNQIDIPISQGENVDIRIKHVYDFGQPYITMTSSWSDIVNIPFPDELAKDVPILSIIDENNNDIESNKFSNMLETMGVNTHIADMITDQNLTFFHGPDNIASGFYTDERRIIPLKDKLLSMSNDIAQIKSDISDVNTNYSVNVSIGDNITQIYSDRDNIITLEGYTSFKNGDDYDFTDGNYSYNNSNGVVSTILNISITNISANTLKLYSIFPGSRTIPINDTTSMQHLKYNYCLDTEDKSQGVYYTWKGANEKTKIQTQNQFVTFRIKDIWTGFPYYSSGSKDTYQNEQISTGLPTLTPTGSEPTMVLYPYLNEEYGLCLNNDNIRSYLVLNPGEEVTIPVKCEYKVDKNNASITKVLSFDIKTSLYTDPTNYAFEVVAKNTTTVLDKLHLTNSKMLTGKSTSNTTYTSTVK